jgi:hypothetical protein
VDKNLFLDMGVFLEGPNFVKRFVGRRYPSLGGRSQGVCTKFGQAHPFGRHMVLDGVVLALRKRQTKQRRRRYVARTPKYTQVTIFILIVQKTDKTIKIKALIMKILE